MLRCVCGEGGWVMTCWCVCMEGGGEGGHDKLRCVWGGSTTWGRPCLTA